MILYSLKALVKPNFYRKKMRLFQYHLDRKLQHIYHQQFTRIETL